MLLALVAPPRATAVSRPRASATGKGGRSGSSRTKVRKSSRVGKFDRRAGRFGAYQPVVRPPVAQVARFMRFGRTPLLLALLVAAGLLVWLFWPQANSKGPRGSKQENQTQGPIPGEILFQGYRTGTYTKMSSVFETFDPGTSQLSPRPDVSYGGSWVEQITGRGMKWVNYYENEDNTPQQDFKQTAQFLSFDPAGNWAGNGVWVGEVFTRSRGAVGTIGEGSVFTRRERSWISGVQFGGEVVDPPGFQRSQPQRWPSALPAARPAPVPATTPAVPAVAPAEVPAPAPLPAAAPLPGGAPLLTPQRKPGGVGFKPQPARAPAIPATAQPLGPDAKPATPLPVPPPVTPPGTTVLPGGIDLPANGPKPTLQSISNELGKIEKKAEILLARPQPDLGIGDLTDLLQLLLSFLEEPYEGGEAQLSSPCEKGPDGSPLPPTTVSWGSGAGRFNEMRAMLMAVMSLLQVSKDLKQPVCQPSRATGDPFTVVFEEVPGGGGGGSG